MKNSEISKERLLYLKNKKLGKISVNLTRILLLVLMTFLWEILARLNVIDSFLMSIPLNL